MWFNFDLFFIINVCYYANVIFYVSDSTFIILIFLLLLFFLIFVVQAFSALWNIVIWSFAVLAEFYCPYIVGFWFDTIIILISEICRSGWSTFICVVPHFTTFITFDMRFVPAVLIIITKIIESLYELDSWLTCITLIHTEFFLYKLQYM